MDDLVLLELERQKVLRSIFRLKLTCFFVATAVAWLLYLTAQNAALSAGAFVGELNAKATQKAYEMG